MQLVFNDVVVHKAWMNKKIRIQKRPSFDDIIPFDEFNKYYWYREELMQIQALEGEAAKRELNYIIEQYF